MSNLIIRIDELRGANAREIVQRENAGNAAAQSPALRLLEPRDAFGGMRATASLADIILQLRASAEAAQAGLRVMREGSAELIRLSGDLTRETTLVAAHIDVVRTALGKLGDAVGKLQSEYGSRTIH